MSSPTPEGTENLTHPSFFENPLCHKSDKIYWNQIEALLRCLSYTVGAKGGLRTSGTFAQIVAAGHKLRLIITKQPFRASMNFSVRNA